MIWNIYISGQCKMFFCFVEFLFRALIFLVPQPEEMVGIDEIGLIIGNHRSTSLSLIM